MVNPWDGIRGLSFACAIYEGLSKSFRTESITKCKLTFGISRCCPFQRAMAAKFTRLAHKIAVQLQLVAESCNICSSRSRRLLRKLLDTHSYLLSRFMERVERLIGCQLYAIIPKYITSILWIPKIFIKDFFLSHECLVIYI
jgi:hypothetical protein